MKESPLHIKSFEFALKIVALSKRLRESKEYILSKQLLRSGTAIGALIREAEFAQSTPDYINKFSIALKEANETLYWLDLLFQSGYIEFLDHQTLTDLNKELISMLVSSIKTLKSKL